MVGISITTWTVLKVVFSYYLRTCQCQSAPSLNSLTISDLFVKFTSWSWWQMHLIPDTWYWHWEWKCWPTSTLVILSFLTESEPKISSSRSSWGIAELIYIWSLYDFNVKDWWLIRSLFHYINIIDPVFQWTKIKL